MVVANGKPSAGLTSIASVILAQPRIVDREFRSPASTVLKERRKLSADEASDRAGYFHEESPHWYIEVCKRSESYSLYARGISEHDIIEAETGKNDATSRSTTALGSTRRRSDSNRPRNQTRGALSWIDVVQAV